MHGIGKWEGVPLSVPSVFLGQKLMEIIHIFVSID
jgi:hypothetical protein